METELCSTAKSYTELLDNAGIQTKLGLLGRHNDRIERTFHRCLRELKALQTNDAIAAALPGKLIEIRPPLASATEIARMTKRTQWASSNPLPPVTLSPVTLRWSGETENNEGPTPNPPAYVKP